MKENRRNFLKKAAIGSAAISSAAGFGIINAGCSLPGKNKMDTASAGNAANWNVTFGEQVSAVLLKNGPVSVKGRLEFVSGKDTWTISKSRDRLTERYTLIDPQGNAQGYFSFNQIGGRLELFFYHRSGKSYEGALSLSGEITFPADGFACRTRASGGERVLSLGSGAPDSILNDSLFSPESDTALRLDAPEVSVKTTGPGNYSFKMSGRIDKSPGSVLVLILENDYYRNRYVPFYHPIDRKRCPKAPTGWMSWNTYFDKATAEDNLAEARIGQKYLQPFGCEFWHIESWQGNSDKLPVRNFYNMNLEVSERKFPEGMKKLADDIRSLGFRPGIWMAPFGTGNAEFYNAHKDWFVHDREGKPVQCWNGRYTVDPTVPEALAHLKKIHDVAAHEWGYEYFKIDGMSGGNQSYGAHFYERPEIRERLKDPSCPNPYELAVQSFREGMGNDRVYLACGGHSTGPDVLYVDAMRIGADVVHPDKPVVWAGVYDQGRCTLNRVYTNNIVTYTDPDTLLVHDLTLEEARVSATVVALPGQLTFFADKLAGLDDERMKLLQQTLPVADVRPLSLYPYYSMLPVWNLHVHNKILDDYNVVALFNWEDEKKVISFTPAELGTDPEGEYVLYEFWTQKGQGKMKGSFSAEIPPHSVRLFTVHPLKSNPQWLGSDRHIAQNAMELSDYKWREDLRSIDGKIKLTGAFPLTMRLNVPDGFSFTKAECTGAGCTAMKEAKNILAVTFLSEKSQELPFSLKF